MANRDKSGFWDSPLPYEAGEAFEAYLIYRNMGVDRNVQDAYIRSIPNRPVRSRRPKMPAKWTEWAETFDWESRAAIALKIFSSEWDRRLEELGESKEAYRCFCIYMNLGRERSRKKAWWIWKHGEDEPYDKTSSIPTGTEQWIRKFLWKDRVFAFDESERIRIRKERIQLRSLQDAMYAKDMEEIYGKIIRVVKRALDDMIENPPTRVTFHGLALLIDSATQVRENSISQVQGRVTNIIDSFRVLSEENILDPDLRAEIVVKLEELQQDFRVMALKQSSDPRASEDEDD
jgi:hypothetical protein